MQYVRRELGAALEQGFGLARREFGQELSTAVPNTVGLHQEDELVGGEPHRDLGGDFLEG